MDKKDSVFLWIKMVAYILYLTAAISALTLFLGFIGEELLWPHKLSPIVYFFISCVLVVGTYLIASKKRGGNE